MSRKRRGHSDPFCQRLIRKPCTTNPSHPTMKPITGAALVPLQSKIATFVGLCREVVARLRSVNYRELTLAFIGHIRRLEAQASYCLFLNRWPIIGGVLMTYFSISLSRAIGYAFTDESTRYELWLDWPLQLTVSCFKALFGS
jgi:hypothetical protein